MLTKDSFFIQLILPLNLMDLQQVNRNRKKQQVKNIYMLRKKNILFQAYLAPKFSMVIYSSFLTTSNCK